MLDCRMSDCIVENTLIVDDMGSSICLFTGSYRSLDNYIWMDKEVAAAFIFQNIAEMEVVDDC